MLNLAFALLPSLARSWDGRPVGTVRRVARWIGEGIRYRRALHELRRLDGGDLDELNLGRADLPGLAERHARGLEPLAPSQLGSLRRL
jgi:uncharacterized protein YjiS (DUF1127 family)